MNANAEIKAQLLSMGSADIEKGLLEDFSGTTLPSAGPGTGLESFFIKFGGHSVRLSINEMSPLKVMGEGNDVIAIPTKTSSEDLYESDNCVRSGASMLADDRSSKAIYR